MNIAHPFKKAMERSPVKDLKQVFMKGIDASYQYEEYNVNVKLFCRFLVKKIVGFW